jgi:CBS domain-containing protein
MTEIRPRQGVYVKELMRSDVKTARPDSSVLEVVEDMNRYGVGSVVVVQGRRPVGIVTEEDVLRKCVERCLDPSRCKAKDIMTTPTMTVREDTSLEEATSLMVTHRIRRIPVLRGTELAGIITATDLIENEPSLVQRLGKSAKTLRLQE